MDAYGLGSTDKFFTFAVQKQDVPGGDPHNAGLAQARGDGLACFAKADKTKCKLHVSHIASCRSARRS